jgi:hypothetical protein
MVENHVEQNYSEQFNMDGIITSDNTLVLKLVKKGSTYTAYCSADGKNFQKVGETDVVLKDVQAGLLAIDGTLPARFAGFRRFMPQGNPPATPFEVAFDYFRIENSGLKY